MMLQTDPRTGYLPAGIHEAAWGEVVNCFAGNIRRKRLTEGLFAACRNLAGAGCIEILLDGSFVTEKPIPGDYDAAWETVGVVPERLDPVLLDSRNGFAAARAKYLGDLFPASGVAEPGVLFRDFFRTDRDGVEKGIVLVDLRSMP